MKEPSIERRTLTGLECTAVQSDRTRIENVERVRSRYNFHKATVGAGEELCGKLELLLSFDEYKCQTPAISAKAYLTLETVLF